MDAFITQNPISCLYNYATVNMNGRCKIMNSKRLLKKKLGLGEE